MGFIAGTVVEVLNWDFRAMPGATDDDKGITPSPSTELMDLFKLRYHGLMEALTQADVNVEKKDEETSLEAATRLLEEATKPLGQRLQEVRGREDDNSKNAKLVTDEMVRILADVCGGSPTEAQIRLLPGRELMAFVAYMNEQLSLPKFNFAEQH